jgi:hypothetical protein
MDHTTCSVFRTEHGDVHAFHEIKILRTTCLKIQKRRKESELDNSTINFRLICLYYKHLEVYSINKGCNNNKTCSYMHRAALS